MSNQFVFIVIVLGFLILAVGVAMYWRRIKDALSPSTPPPPPDPESRDLRNRLEKAIQENHETSEELRKLVVAVLDQNDRLSRRHHAGGNHV